MDTITVNKIQTLAKNNKLRSLHAPTLPDPWGAYYRECTLEYHVVRYELDKSLRGSAFHNYMLLGETRLSHFITGKDGVIIRFI